MFSTPPPVPAVLVAPAESTASTSVPLVPFYSQFKDITSSVWQKQGCGITSLAMLIDYYQKAVPVDTLLKQGIASGAYISNVGWSYAGLIGVAKKYGLTGSSYDLKALDSDAAFSQFTAKLKDGQVIASVHYQFDPKSTSPHLVVIDGIDGDTVYYNDPAAKGGEKTITAKSLRMEPVDMPRR